MLSKATAATVSKEVSRLDLVGFTVSISVQQTIINGHSCGPLCLRVLEGLCVVFHRFVCLLILQCCKIPAHEYPSRHSQAFFHYFLSYLVLTFSVMRSFLSIDRAKKKKKRKKKKWMYASAIILYQGTGVQGRTVYSALENKSSLGGDFSFYFMFSQCPHVLEHKVAAAYFLISKRY